MIAAAVMACDLPSSVTGILGWISSSTTYLLALRLRCKLLAIHCRIYDADVKLPIFSVLQSPHGCMYLLVLREALNSKANFIHSRECEGGNGDRHVEREKVNHRNQFAPQ